MAVWTHQKKSSAEDFAKFDNPNQHSLPEGHHHSSKNTEELGTNVHHHDSATRISSLFPVDPEELETRLHVQNHHNHEHSEDESDMKVRKKRHSNLLADADSVQWIDDNADEKDFPEDLFHYYVKGGEGMQA